MPLVETERGTAERPAHEQRRSNSSQPQFFRLTSESEIQRFGRRSIAPLPSMSTFSVSIRSCCALKWPSVPSKLATAHRTAVALESF